MKNLVYFIGATLGMLLLIETSIGQAPTLERWAARDLKPNFQNEDTAFFSAPVAIECDGENVYVIDAQENEIKVFSKQGGFIRAIGRKGQGPGEFNSPADLDFYQGKLYISDKLNYRIQILDKNGRYLSSFKLPFGPDQICVVEGEKVVVSHLPLGIEGREKLIQCLSGQGTLLWEAVDSFYSGDRIYDTFRNMTVLNRGKRGDWYLIRKSDERSISHLDARGRLVAQIPVAEAYPLKKIVLPTSGRRKELWGFCWASAFDQGNFYLLSPKYTKEKDLGPGQEIYRISLDGCLTGLIVLPATVKKIAVEKNRIFAVDSDNFLRVFQFENR